MTENLFRNNIASFFMSTAALSVKGTDKMKNLKAEAQNIKKN